MIRSQLFHLTWPIFVETALVMLVGIVDVFMLGGYSDEAVGAVGVVNQIVNMVFLVFQMVTTGTAVLCSRYMGRGDRESVRIVVGVSIALNIVLGVVVSVVLYAFAEPIMVAMGVREELMGHAVQYMEIVGGFAFLQAMTFTFTSVFRSLQRPKIPMVGIMIVNVINFLGDYLLIYGKCGLPELGTEGAAIASVVSRGIAFVFMLIAMKRVLLPDFKLRYIYPVNWKYLWQVLQIGIPSGCEMLSYSAAQVVALYFINLVGNEAVIAKAYVANIVLVSYILSAAVAQSCSITVGWLIGKQRPNTAFVITRYCTKIAIFVAIGVAVLLALCGRPIISSITDNAEVIRLVSIVLWVDVVLEIGRALNMIVIQALRAAGDYIFPVAFGAISVWGWSVLAAYLFGVVFGWGLIGIWVTFALDEHTRGWTMLRRWNKGGWKKKLFVD